MTPEEKARVKIDQMFEDASWKVVDRDFYTPTLTAAAIREGLLEGNREADYFPILNSRENQGFLPFIPATKVYEHFY